MKRTKYIWLAIKLSLFGVRLEAAEKLPFDEAICETIFGGNFATIVCAHSRNLWSL